MKKKIVLPILAVAIAALIIGSSTFVNAQSSGWGMFGGDRDGDCQEFFENNDYEGWKNFINEKAADFPSQENFENLQRVHDLMTAGKIEEAESLRTELGISRGENGAGQRGKKMNDIRDAIAARDYETWKTVMENKKVHRGSEIEISLSAETFSKLVEAHQAREAGDNVRAREIHEELGFPGGPNQRNKKGLGNGLGPNSNQ